MLSFVNLELIQEMIDEWNEVKERADIILPLQVDEDQEIMYYIQILEGEMRSDCGVPWNRCKYVSDWNYSGYWDGQISGGRYEENKFDFIFKCTDEWEGYLEIPREIGKKIRPKLYALIKDYERLNSRR